MQPGREQAMTALVQATVPVMVATTPGFAPATRETTGGRYSDSLASPAVFIPDFEKLYPEIMRGHPLDVRQP